MTQAEAGRGGAARVGPREGSDGTWVCVSSFEILLRAAGFEENKRSLTSYSLHLLRYLLHSEGIPFPRVIIVFEYYKGRRLRPKEVVYFGRLEPVDPPALVHHGGQGLVAYCSFSHGGQLPSATLYRGWPL